MDKDDILKVLAEIGKDLAWYADPSSHAYENRYRAAAYVPKLEACRVAYSHIRRGTDPLPILFRLLRVMHTGGEYNFVSLLIGAVRGQRNCLEHPAILAALNKPEVKP